jgi:chaperonin GroES
MAIKPLGDRILLKVLEAEGKTRGGIYLPDTAKEKPQEGEIIAVGEGQTLENGTVKKPAVKKGDRVLFGKYSGTEVSTKKGEKYLIVKEEDILAIIK